MGPPVVWSFTVALAVWAGWLDWRQRRIPNWLTVPGFVLGVTANAMFGGWTGLKLSLAGAGLCLAVLLPFVWARGMGAGDWKLMGALGAWLGPQQIWVVLFLAALISGAMALVQMIVRRKVRETLHNLWMLICSFCMFGLRPYPHLTLDNPRALKLPFGVAAAAATVVCFSAIVVRPYMGF